ncbi:P-loop containing nucleoside triphosphate hydrolase protein [Fomitiporia mediterranea MF3/22]|uniref:P-loop containing nucleoside triphosphate hydrolase protein n=1 Tax=Fomitiporia mediterranea (strain MF3/22) TaxID=694068 RepID=UPI0004408EF3|nr:P-loop containing nucleoside triphosphate hydrolase protein [Fomitiporia mediterranea MF3/22]EJD08519.1 P-loop containing nucleoside triphosphate hydrolase protein [Fomitiporia mediterranea MF3/22]
MSTVRSSATESLTTVHNSPAVKKYKAALSTEVKTRRMTKTGSASCPGSPRTPMRSQSRCEDVVMESKMDVSRIDPEQALVDAENVDVDLNFELDERELRSMQYGWKDKVPCINTSSPYQMNASVDCQAFGEFAETTATISQAPGTPAPEYHYNRVLVGSDNKFVYCAAAQGRIEAAMNGYNSPGIIPRAMKDVFAFIRRTPSREYLLRCSCLEIYNEVNFDLLAPPSVCSAVQIQGIGDNVILALLREEVVTSLKGVHELLDHGYGNRRTASTDWNERSSGSHSILRLAIESRERESVSEVEDGQAAPFVPHLPGVGVKFRTDVRNLCKNGSLFSQEFELLCLIFTPSSRTLPIYYLFERKVLRTTILHYLSNMSFKSTQPLA